MAYGSAPTTAPASAPASRSKKAAAVLLAAGLCATALVATRGPTSAFMSGKAAEADAGRVEATIAQYGGDMGSFNQWAASRDYAMSSEAGSVSLPESEKTDQNTCLNHLLAGLVTKHTDAVADNKGVIGTAFIEENTGKDDYSNARNVAALKDTSYLPVASTAALASVVTAFMHANEVIEAAQWVKDNGAMSNARDVLLLEPTTNQVSGAKAFVEHVKESYDDVTGKCYITECKPGKGHAFHAKTGGSCTSCVAGTSWNALTDDEPCADVLASCPAGQGYSRSTSKVADSSCHSCAAGTWSGANDDNACAAHAITTCPAGEELTAGNAHRDGTCAHCSATTFKAGPGAGACGPHTVPGCSAGNEPVAGTRTANAHCQACTGSSFSTGGGNACAARSHTSCGPGFGFAVGDLTKDDSCADCVDGHFSKHTSHNACLVFETTTCGAGQQLTVGTSSSDGHCTACASGYWKATTGPEVCAVFRRPDCTAGNEAVAGSGSADASCAACSAGKFSAGGGEACEPHGSPACTLGFGHVAGSSSADHACVACTHGFFSADTDDSACAAHSAKSSWSCPAGEESETGTAIRDTHCTPCLSGKFSAGGTGPCAEHAVPSCTAGTELTIGTATTDASCTACASGTFSPGDSTGCSSHTMPSCGAGYGSITGSASADHSCEVCAAGKFSTTTDASVCSAHSAATSCPAGQDSQAGDESSDTHCEACAEGLVKEAAGTEACTKAVCTPERISHPEVAVFNQKGLNGGGIGDESDENSNLLSIIQNRMDNHHEGYRINTGITSFGVKDLKGKLDGATFFFMTDMESGNPRDASFLPASARGVLRKWVSDGGVILMTATGGDNDNAFMNEIFGWDTTQSSLSSQPMNAANAVGTSFEGGPGTATYSNHADSIGLGSVPGAKPIYGSAGSTALAILPYDAGLVIFLGFDFYAAGFANNWGDGTHTDGYQRSDEWVTELLPRALKYAATMGCGGITAPPVDCAGTYGGWTGCTASCGGGSQTQYFTIHTDRLNGGAACPAASRTQSCNTGCCPVNCAGYWGGYGACSADCAGGQHGDTYYHSRSASCGGSGCPYHHGYVSWASCNTHACWWDVARTGW